MKINSVETVEQLNKRLSNSDGMEGEFADGYRLGITHAKNIVDTMVLIEKDRLQFENSKRMIEHKDIDTVIHDLEALGEYYEEEVYAKPLCIIAAIELLKEMKGEE